MLANRERANNIIGIEFLFYGFDGYSFGKDVGVVGELVRIECRWPCAMRPVIRKQPVLATRIIRGISTWEAVNGGIGFCPSRQKRKARDKVVARPQFEN